MSLAASDRIQGFRASLDVAGEQLHLLDGTHPVATVCALVNRSDFKVLTQGEINFDERNATTVEFLICDLTPVPRVGQYLKDSVDVYHRIAKLRRTDISWFAMCEPQAEVSFE